MTLENGTRLGPYEIQSAIGAGGMGEVYRARDTRLDRTVAIKVLPAKLADDPMFRERFEREARAVAALNHPHICALYDVGEAPSPAHAGPGLPAPGSEPAPIRFLVMEYLEGETLAGRLSRGPLPLDQALRHALNMAGALDKAHRQGIVHRDLKPANVILTKAGAKLLDFGLARLTQRAPAPAFSAVSALPTEAGNLTAQGTILGTLQYMAPEQLEGKDADARTDIFALGTIVYEMVTGRKAFEGKTQVSLIGAILEREPAPMASVQPMSPPALDAIVKRCLAKDPDERWQSASDLAVGLSWFLGPASAVPSAVSAASAGSSRGSVRAQRLWMSLAGVLGLATIGLLAMEAYQRQPAVASQAVLFSVSAPDKARFETPLFTGSGAPVGGSISPDGRKLAFTARDASGTALLWVRPLDALAAQALPGTDDAALPFWSPDSRTIGFFAPGKLKRIDIAGGPPQVLCDVGRGQGGTWNREGIILFAPNLRSGLSRVSAAGGDPAIVTKLGEGERTHRFPYFLPDGRHFLYYAEGSRTENTGVFVAALEALGGRRVLAADSAAVFAPPGQLLFVRQGTLFAQRFDVAKLQTAGDPVRLAQSVPFEGTAPAFSVSDTGVLTYRTGTGDLDQQLAWFDRAGKVLEIVGTPGSYRGVDLSPDGQRIAVHRHDGNGGDIWIFEPRGTTTRLTFDPTQDNASPIWSPDGSRIAFGSLRNGKWGVYHKLASGEGNEELLIESDIPKIPASWSPNGKYIVYWLYDPRNGVHQWLLPLTGAELKPAQLMHSRFFESHSQVSPDSKWIAYISDETGRVEVYVRPFPSGEGVWQVSTSGGLTPRWRRDGKELFYATGYDHGKLMAVGVGTAGGAFVPGVSRELFDMDMAIVPHSTAVQNYHTYAVSPDGQRFLIPRPVSKLRSGVTSTPITVVLDWTALLKN